MTTEFFAPWKRDSDGDNNYATTTRRNGKTYMIVYATREEAILNIGDADGMAGLEETQVINCCKIMGIAGWAVSDGGQIAWKHLDGMETIDEGIAYTMTLTDNPIELALTVRLQPWCVDTRGFDCFGDLNPVVGICHRPSDTDKVAAWLKEKSLPVIPAKTTVWTEGNKVRMTIDNPLAPEPSEYSAPIPEDHQPGDPVFGWKRLEP